MANRVTTIDPAAQQRNAHDPQPMTPEIAADHPGAPAPICQPHNTLSVEDLQALDQILGLDNPAAEVRYPVAIIVWRGPFAGHRDPERRAQIVISRDRTPAPNRTTLLIKAHELATLQAWGTVQYHYYICSANDQPTRCQELHDCLCSTFDTLLTAAA